MTRSVRARDRAPGWNAAYTESPDSLAAAWRTGKLHYPPVSTSHCDRPPHTEQG